jgi:dTDP-4-dehydrorhamnose reductase
VKKKIYIAGGAGMLGEAFNRQFGKDYELRVTDINQADPWIEFLDFRDYKAYRADVTSFNPDYLFHIGAHTNLEYCERNSTDAYATNTTSVEYAVSISNELNIPLLYIGTAGIFDGKKNGYDESDAPNPLGHYAKSKWLGEKCVAENKKDYLICRAGWMMGGGPAKDKKFVGKIMSQITEGRKELKIVNDKFGTPTYTNDFADNVKLLLEKEHWGLYNMACADQTSRMDVTKEILRILGKENEIGLTEVSSDYFRDEYFAPRPASEQLVNAKLNELQLNRMRDWRICLREYIRYYYSDNSRNN